MKFALIGGSLSHSYSEEIHNLFFKYTGIKGTYDLVEVPESSQLDEKIKWFQSQNYRGINVTIPHKEDVLKYVDNISDEVQKLGLQIHCILMMVKSMHLILIILDLKKHLK